MIDLATGWKEIRSVPEARGNLVANQVDLAWLTRYPLSNKITVDRGRELLAESKTMIANDNRIPSNYKISTTKRNCRKGTPNY